MPLNRWLRLKTVLISWAILELAGFIWLGSWLGVLPVVLLIFVTGCLGSYILRKKGFEALKRSMESMQDGGFAPLPADNGLGFISGFLLLIPGFFSDVVGLILLLPFVQTAFSRWLIKRGLMRDQKRQQSKGSADQPRIIEGKFKREDDHQDKK